MKNIRDISFKNKKVLIRVDFNVALDKNTLQITDDSRIRAALPTLNKVLDDGGSCILMSHLGRPLKKLKVDGSIDYDRFSLQLVLSRLSNLTGKPIHFVNNCIGPEVKNKAGKLLPGEILLLENLRFHKEEEKGDENFATELSSLGDYYINDAFGTAHRNHASTAVIAHYFKGNCCPGFLMAAELENAEKVLNQSLKPFTAIMGGAKVSDKILIIEQLLNKVDNLIIGGGMMFTFAKAMGYETGSSICEEDKMDLAKHLIQLAIDKGVNLLLPVDTVIADRFEVNATTEICPISDIRSGWMGLDIGPKSIELFSACILQSKTILWNGPMGVFEMTAFEQGTKDIALAIANASENGAYSLIGGGDSAAAIKKFGLENKVNYVSTGGGALLEYFEGKELPGVASLIKNS